MCAQPVISLALIVRSGSNAPSPIRRKKLTAMAAVDRLGFVNLQGMSGRFRCSRCGMKAATYRLLPPVKEHVEIQWGSNSGWHNFDSLQYSSNHPVVIPDCGPPPL